MSALKELMITTKDKATVAISLRCGKDDLERFDDFCRKHNKNRSAMLNLFIENVEKIYESEESN